MLNKLCHLMIKYNGGENCVDPDQLADLGLYFFKKIFLLENSAALMLPLA